MNSWPATPNTLKRVNRGWARSPARAQRTCFNMIPNTRPRIDSLGWLSLLSFRHHPSSQVSSSGLTQRCLLHKPSSLPVKPKNMFPSTRHRIHSVGSHRIILLREAQRLPHHRTTKGRWISYRPGVGVGVGVSGNPGNSRSKKALPPCVPDPGRAYWIQFRPTT